jgi:DNA topoisomerase-1
MEDALDLVAQGGKNWRRLLDEFYADFSKKLELASRSTQGMRANDPTDTDIACSLCGRHMQIRTGSTGVFLGCSGYALPPKERCKNTMNLVSGDEVIDAEADDEAESRQLRSKHRCKLCNSAMDSYLLDESRKLHICGNNPDCPGYEVEQGSYRLKGYEGPTIECDKCSSEMQLKTGRFGKYFGCTNGECKNTRKLLKSGEAAPPKVEPIAMPELRCEKVDDYYVLRDGAAGLFLAASQFPKNRETRAPYVEELLAHKDKIDPKYHFLLTAPTRDAENNKAIIRFSRKTKEQYVQTEVNGKATGWKAFYSGGKWQVQK